ncbi:hypothetical protein [Persicobacter psychrovividus]|uniref:Right handed beta helix domain-containing protein n=1 Tax=Persicobacter psychrovividus TaxID=387638 RepID=A0ABM7VL06_9BACT|nr:hypothetical protein PEPS_39530 [Persicobacter psychrovividus]
MKLLFLNLLMILSLVSYQASGQVIKVAAKDATAAEKAAAKYQCNGQKDQVEINNALKEGKTVELSSGNFSCDGTINGGANILQGKGKGTTKIVTTAGTGLKFQGSRSERNKFSATIQKGAKKIDIKKDLSPWVNPGDRVLITSDDMYCGLRQYYRKGESVIVERVEGSSLVLQSGLKDTYTTNIRVYTYNMINNVGVENLTFEVRNSSISLFIENATNVFYKNIDLKDPTEKCWQGFRISHVYGFVYQNLRAEGILHDHSSNNPHGYGFYLSGAEDGELLNCYGYNNKHSFEVSGYGYVPVTRNIVIKDCVADNDWKAGFSTHGAASGIDWINCTVKEGNGGFLIRSDNNRIINPKVSFRSGAYNAPFFIGEYTQQGGTWDKYDGIGGDQLVIENAEVNCNNNSVPYFQFRDPIRTVHISGGTFQGARNGILFGEGKVCDDFDLKDVTFKAGGMKTLFDIHPKSGAPTLHISFENVNICGATDGIDLLKTDQEVNLTMKGVDMGCN